MLADKPRSIIDDLRNPIQYWKDVTSPVFDDLKDLTNARLIYDGCNAGIAVGDGGTFNFYRNKYCVPPPKIAPPDPDKPVTPNLPTSCSQGVFVNLTSGHFETEIVGAGTDIETYFLIKKTSVIKEVVFPPPDTMDMPGGGNRKVVIYVDIEINSESKLNGRRAGNGIVPSQNNYDSWIARGGTITGERTDLDAVWDFVYSATVRVYWNGAASGFNNVVLAKTPSGADPSAGISMQYMTASQYNALVSVPHITNVATSPDIDRTIDIYQFHLFCTNYKLENPPPPPPKKKRMECCPNNEQLLKLILKRIGEPQKVTIFDEDLDRKGTQKADKTPQSLNEYLQLSVQRVEIVNRLLGIDNFPMTVPDTMITPFQEGVFAKVFKFIDGKKKRKINSITELIAWMSEQDSAVLGEFHQVIQFETEDKKTSSVVLPNVAEALKEIVLLTSQMARQNNTQTELIFKIAAEVVATKAVASKGTEIAQDIQDYLDYPTETKTKTIPCSLSLPKVITNNVGVPIATAKSENPKNFLKSGDIKFVYEDWTGSNSLHDQLLDLLQLAAMLRAIYYQRTDKE